MNPSIFRTLILAAYDPIRSGVFLNGDRVVGAAADRVYRRVSSTEHELHLQATSASLQRLHVGYVGELTLQLHAGADRNIDIYIGKVEVKSLYVEELGSEVPVVVVVLKTQK